MKRLIFGDSPVPLPKDRIVATMNRTTTEWDRKMRKLKRKKMLRKQQARE